MDSQVHLEATDFSERPVRAGKTTAVNRTFIVWKQTGSPPCIVWVDLFGLFGCFWFCWFWSYSRTRSMTIDLLTRVVTRTERSDETTVSVGRPKCSDGTAVESNRHLPHGVFSRRPLLQIDSWEKCRLHTLPFFRIVHPIVFVQAKYRAFSPGTVKDRRSADKPNFPM